MTNPVELSVVVPVLNEAGNIPPLIAEIAAALCGRVAFEIVYVDDGSTDRSVDALRALQSSHANLRILRHAGRCGQSAALRSGVKAAHGRWIATLDGDGQNDPADIPKLLAKRDAIDPALASRADARLLLAGERVARQDVWSKRVASRWANRLRQKLLQDHTPDTGCGLKLFPRALYLDLPYFDHMHRYLGALTLRQGGQVVSVPVNHRPRLRGASKYGILDRALVGIGDLIGVMWLQRRGRIPQVTEDGQ